MTPGGRPGSSGTRRAARGSPRRGLETETPALTQLRTGAGSIRVTGRHQRGGRVLAPRSGGGARTRGPRRLPRRWTGCDSAAAKRCDADARLPIRDGRRLLRGGPGSRNRNTRSRPRCSAAPGSPAAGVVIPVRRWCWRSRGARSRALPRADDERCRRRTRDHATESGKRRAASTRAAGCRANRSRRWRPIASRACCRSSRSRSPRSSCTQLNSASLCISPRLKMMFGQVIRPGSLCTNPFWPPSATSTGSTVTSRPRDLLENPDLDVLDLEQEAARGRRLQAERQRAQDQLARTYALMQIHAPPARPARSTTTTARTIRTRSMCSRSSSVVQRPVQVVGEVGDLLPERVGRVAHHDGI